MSSFNWDLFSDVGHHLLEYSDEENYQRSSVGRFYYSIFGLTKEYYEKTHHQYIPSFQSHYLLIEFLLNSVYEEEKILGEYLRKLRKFRVNADYHSNFNQKYTRYSKFFYIKSKEIIDSLNENPVVPKF